MSKQVKSAYERASYVDRAAGAFFMLMVVAELLSVAWPKAGVVGAYLWFAANFAFCVLAVLLVGSLFRRGRVLSLLTLGLYALLFYVSFADPRNVSHEATQELSCALNKLRESADLGFRSWCFLGYPTRQYYLSTLPTLAFGPSQAALNGGMILYFFLGLTFFLFGIESIFRDGVRGDVVAAVAGVLLLHVGWFDYQFLAYEQAIFPLGLSLIVTGLFLCAYAYRHLAFLAFAALAAYLSIFSYTPGLAVTVLSIPVIVGAAWATHRPPMRSFAILAAIALVIGFVVSIGIRDDLHLVSPSAATGQSSATKLAELGRVVIARNEFSPGLMTPLLAGLLLAGYLSLFVVTVALAARGYLASRTRSTSTPQGSSAGGRSAWLHMGAAAIVVVVWAVGVVLLSALSPGYAKPPVHFAIHRAMIVFPPLLAILALLLSRTYRLVPLQLIVLAVVFGFGAQRGVSGFFRLYSGKGPDEKFLLLQWMERELHRSKGPVPIRVFFADNLRGPFGNLYDYSLYFGPPVKYDFVSACDDIGRLRKPDERALIVQLPGRRLCEPEQSSVERRYRVTLARTTYDAFLLDGNASPAKG
jgi:hypothetical protein